MASRQLFGKVMVAHDDDQFAVSMATALQRAGHQTVDAPCDAVLHRIHESFQADLVVLVLSQGGASQLERLAAPLRDGDVPFVYVTESPELGERLAAFAAGADDVIVRPFAVPELQARVQVILRRAGRRTDLHRIGDLVVDESAHTATLAGEPIELTSLEFALLGAFVRNRRQVLSKGQLLEDVWGHERADVNLVEVHVSALRRKLERRGPRLIHTVRGAGYVLRPEDEPPTVTLVAG